MSSGSVRYPSGRLEGSVASREKSYCAGTSPHGAAMEWNVPGTDYAGGSPTRAPEALPRDETRKNLAAPVDLAAPRSTCE